MCNLQLIHRKLAFCDYKTHKHIPYSGKFLHGANFRIFRMKASVCENKKCEIYANVSTRTYVSTRGLN